MHTGPQQQSHQLMGKFSTFFNQEICGGVLTLSIFRMERRGEPSQGREDPVGVGEDARS